MIGEWGMVIGNLGLVGTMPPLQGWVGINDPDSIIISSLRDFFGLWFSNHGDHKLRDYYCYKSTLIKTNDKNHRFLYLMNDSGYLF
ncbi:MAG: hypothetical protein EBS35_05195 [Bacteroidetes bacterium]|nr:hypothetical protein [Bacteroidota bacterium]